RERLRLDLGKIERVAHDEPALLGEHRERALQRADAHLARRAVAPVLRLERVGHAAARVVRRADRTLAGAAGALLAVELLRRAAPRAALLRRLGAGAARRELRLHHLVEEVLLHLGAEDLVCEIELADLLALQVENSDLHGGPSYDLISTSTPAERSSFINASR